MKKIISAVLILCFCLVSLNGCGGQSNQPNKKSENTPPEEEQRTNYTMNVAGGFSAGVAWVEFKDLSGQKYVAIINKEGKIIYKSIKHNYSNDEFNGQGMLCYCFKDNKDDPFSFILINNEGKVIATSGSEWFDSVLAVSDGMALVYKKTSTISEASFTIGVIGKDGSYVVSPMHFDGLSDHFDKKSTSGVYRSPNIWAIYSDDSTIYLNMSNGKYMSAGKNSSLFFANGVGFSQEILGSDQGISRHKGTYGKFDSNFNLTEVSADYFSDKILNQFLIHKKEGSITVTNLLKNKKFNIDTYDVDVGDIEFKSTDGKLIECIKGKDKKSYFVIIDENGNKVFGPEAYGYSILLNENILNYENEDGKSVIVDMNNNTITESEYYTSYFFDGLSSVSKDKQYCYINTKGEKVITSVYE